MIDSNGAFTATNDSTQDTSRRSSSQTYPSIYLPKRIYEALPVAYISLGILFILGAVYIGISHWPMAGYLTVGLSCIFAGVAVGSIRHRERSKPGNALA